MVPVVQVGNHEDEGVGSEDGEKWADRDCTE